MLSPDRARRLSEVALAHSGAEATEVAVTAVEEELNRFTQDHPVQNVLRAAARVSVRVHEGGRQGKASTGTLTDESVKRTVERARAVAKLAPAPPEELAPMPGPQEHKLRGEGPLAHDPDTTAKAVRTIVDACRERECQVAGIHDTTSIFRLLRNSRGLDVCDVDNTAELSVSAFQADGAGWSGQIAGDPKGLDNRQAAERAAGKALASRDPQPIDPGHYTVVLEPAAVSSLLLFAAYTGFGAQQVQDGTSFLSGKLGEPVLGDNVTITDDVYHPMTVGPVFDGEGLPRERVTLIEHGVAKGIVHDQNTARRAGCASTGHAQPQPSAEGPTAGNLVLTAGDTDAAGLLAGVDKGILVTQFHYTNVVEPTQLTLTGMTRNGTFLIEKGEIARPLRNLRFTQSLVEALRRVTALGSDAELCSALFGGHVVVPPVRIDGFRFSSSTDF